MAITQVLDMERSQAREGLDESVRAGVNSSPLQQPVKCLHSTPRSVVHSQQLLFPAGPLWYLSGARQEPKMSKDMVRSEGVSAWEECSWYRK